MFQGRSQIYFQVITSTLKITRAPGFSLKDGLGSRDDITWPAPTISPRLSTSPHTHLVPPGNVVDASLTESRNVANHNNGSSSLNDYTLQELFGSRKAPL